MIPENCHCGWRLPEEVRIGKLTIERTAPTSSGAKVEAELRITCPVCSSVYAIDRELVIVGQEVTFTKKAADA